MYPDNGQLRPSPPIPHRVHMTALRGVTCFDSDRTSGWGFSADVTAPRRRSLPVDDRTFLDGRTGISCMNPSGLMRTASAPLMPATAVEDLERPRPAQRDWLTLEIADSFRTLTHPAATRGASTSSARSGGRTKRACGWGGPATRGSGGCRTQGTSPEFATSRKGTDSTSSRTWSARRKRLPGAPTRGRPTTPVSAWTSSTTSLRGAREPDVKPLRAGGGTTSDEPHAVLVVLP